MKLGFKVSTNTPTDDLKDRIILALSGETVDAKISKIAIKASDGTVLGEASVSTNDWANYKLTKDISITQDGEASYFSLETSDGIELYRYVLETPITLKKGDVVHVEWTISVVNGTNMIEVARVLDFIIGSVTDIKIALVRFYYQGELKAGVSPENVVADTAEDKVVVEGSIQPTSDLDYDEIRLVDSAGYVIFRISSSGTLPANVTTSFTITVSIT